MVTIRNDIESNGTANRSPDGTAGVPAGVTDGVKNVNHLANGSRRSTMVDIKSKTFNRNCVGFLALIVCVGVSFSVGMLFLYGHLVDRFNESAIAGTMWHDKNGNPVKPMPTTVGTTAPVTTESWISTSTSEESGHTSTVVPPTTTSRTTTTEASDEYAEEPDRDDVYDLDAYHDDGKRPLPKADSEVTPEKDGQREPPGSSSERPKVERKGQHSSSFPGFDDEGSGEGSGSGDRE